MSSKTLLSIGGVMVALPVFWRLSSPAGGSFTRLFELLIGAVGVVVLIVGYMRQKREQPRREEDEIDMSKLR